MAVHVGVAAFDRGAPLVRPAVFAGPVRVDLMVFPEVFAADRHGRLGTHRPRLFGWAEHDWGGGGEVVGGGNEGAADAAGAGGAFHAVRPVFVGGASGEPVFGTGVVLSAQIDLDQFGVGEVNAADRRVGGSAAYPVVPASWSSSDADAKARSGWSMSGSGLSSTCPVAVVLEGFQDGRGDPLATPFAFRDLSQHANFDEMVDCGQG